MRDTLSGARVSVGDCKHCRPLPRTRTPKLHIRCRFLSTLNIQRRTCARQHHHRFHTAHTTSRPAHTHTHTHTCMHACMHAHTDMHAYTRARAQRTPPPPEIISCPTHNLKHTLPPPPTSHSVTSWFLASHCGHRWREFSPLIRVRKLPTRCS